MKIAFFVNDVMTEQAGYSTTRLAMAATNRGHQSWLIGAEDFDCYVDNRVHAFAYGAPKKKYSTTTSFLGDVQSKRAVRENIVVDDLDILMLRNDPSTDTGYRSWAQTIGITFGQVALQKGVVVVNDPRSLQIATNKMYFQMFPEEVRPKTLISQNQKDIKAFIKDMGGNAVIKPLQGSGGSGVFLVNIEDTSNLNQMIDALTQDGYIIVQEYLSAAAEGDTRLFMMNGKPLRYRGKYAAFR
ncbi:MAG: glutathione synthase, partial [Candidatus Brocadiales bacterium]|nr:glutathione synthase [Candidatus Brocadiales bacterium]